MGAGESRPQDATGLHVLRVAENSPGAEAGVEPFFDFIVGFAGRAISDDTDAFANAVERSENRPIVLQIWSSKRQELRDLRITPHRRWSTVGPAEDADAQPSLLGLSLRACTLDGALDNVWHVLDILEGSPAQDAGLVPYTDYIVGCPSSVLRSEGDFYDLVESHVDKPLRLFVWNYDFDVLRQIVIVPNRSWGAGEGLIGCGIGFGLLHRIPKPQDRPAVFEENDLPEDDSYEDALPAIAPPPPKRGGFEDAAYASDGVVVSSSTSDEATTNGITTKSRPPPLSPRNANGTAAAQIRPPPISPRRGNTPSALPASIEEEEE